MEQQIQQTWEQAFEAGFAALIAGVQERIDADFERNGYQWKREVRFERLKKNIRVFYVDVWDNRSEGSSSVICFVDPETGAIMKGSWKAPVKNGVRGHVANGKNPLAAFTQRGELAYLR